MTTKNVHANHSAFKTSYSHIYGLLNESERLFHFPSKCSPKGRDSVICNKALNAANTLVSTDAGKQKLIGLAKAFSFKGLNHLMMAATGRPGNNRNSAGVRAGWSDLCKAETATVIGAILTLAKMEYTGLSYNGKAVDTIAVKQAVAIAEGKTPELTVNFGLEPELLEKQNAAKAATQTAPKVIRRKVTTNQANKKVS